MSARKTRFVRLQVDLTIAYSAEMDSLPLSLPGSEAVNIAIGNIFDAHNQELKKKSLPTAVEILPKALTRINLDFRKRPPWLPPKEVPLLNVKPLTDADREELAKQAADPAYGLKES